MRWTPVILACLPCLSPLPLSHSDNSLVNSATRKFFFADSHENIDEKRDVARHQDDAESLPFGKLSDKMPTQYRSSPELTIEQFINQLKRIKKTKQNQSGGPGQSRNKSARKTEKPQQRKPLLSQRPARVKSKQADVPLPVTTRGDKKMSSARGVLGKTTGRPPTTSRQGTTTRQGLKKGSTNGLADIKTQKQSKTKFVPRKPSHGAKERLN